MCRLRCHYWISPGPPSVLFHSLCFPRWVLPRPCWAGAAGNDPVAAEGVGRGAGGAVREGGPHPGLAAEGAWPDLPLPILPCRGGSSLSCLLQMAHLPASARQMLRDNSRTHSQERRPPPQSPYQLRFSSTRAGARHQRRPRRNGRTSTSERRRRATPGCASSRSCRTIPMAARRRNPGPPL